MHLHVRIKRLIKDKEVRVEWKRYHLCATLTGEKSDELIKVVI